MRAAIICEVLFKASGPRPPFWNQWKEVATSSEVGLQPNELRDFKLAFRR
jgi:hypothetical protein